ncbi:MAG: hypothetical protein AAGG54_17145, partial [Pseudomonadota bacterium]
RFAAVSPALITRSAVGHQPEPCALLSTPEAKREARQGAFHARRVALRYPACWANQPPYLTRLPPHAFQAAYGQAA